LIVQLYVTTCIEVTVIPSYKAANLACTNCTTQCLYPCIFQTWDAYSPLHHCCHQLMSALDIFLATRPTTNLEASRHQIRHGYTPYTNIVIVVVFYPSIFGFRSAFFNVFQILRPTVYDIN